jgi:hypothetical protein
MTQSFVVIHNIKDEEVAEGLVSILKDYKEYLIKEKFIVVSNENYKIVQIKKNFDEYLTTPKSDFISKNTAPVQNNQQQQTTQTPNQKQK